MWKSGNGLFTSTGGVCVCFRAGLLALVASLLAGGPGVSGSVGLGLLPLLAFGFGLGFGLTLVLLLPPIITPLFLLLLMLVRSLPTTLAELPVTRELMVLLVFGSGGGSGCMSLCWVICTLSLLLLFLLQLLVSQLLVLDFCELLLAGVTGSLRWR